MTKIAALGAEAAPLLAALHAEAFDAPWSETEFAALLKTPGVAALVFPRVSGGGGPLNAVEGAGFDAEPAGFILVRLVADEGEILTLAVCPAKRRQGIGRALVQAAAELARAAGASRLFLEVGVDNPAALALYEGLGFARVGLRRGYYETAQGTGDARVLRLDL